MKGPPALPLIIGTYTEQLPHVHGKADGILSAEFDRATGHIGPVTTLTAARNPSFIVLSASGENLYAVNETLSSEYDEGGAVTAYVRDRDTGALTQLNTRPSGGAAPCHLAIDLTGRFVLVANYGFGSGAVSVYPIEAEGSLGTPTDHIRHVGSGPDPIRQATSHAHMIANDPQTGDILVADLGIDSIMVYTLSGTGRLASKPAERIVTAAGAGPRHLAFHPDGKHLFVVNELDNTVLTLRREGERFQPTNVASTLPADATARSQAGAVHVTPSGRHVLVSNRGHDSIALLRFDDRTETLTLTETAPSQGEQPRDFAVSPDGQHVIVANQDSDLLVSYQLDEDAPALHAVHSAVAPSPVCLAFG